MAKWSLHAAARQSTTAASIRKRKTPDRTLIETRLIASLLGVLRARITRPGIVVGGFAVLGHSRLLEGKM